MRRIDIKKINYQIDKSYAGRCAREYMIYNYELFYYIFVIMFDFRRGRQLELTGEEKPSR